MKVRIAAVGRIRSGPEADLVADYLQRFDKTGRSQGLGPATLREVEAKKGGMAEEALLLEKAISGTDRLCVLDERGKCLSSVEFAKALGASEAAFAIGGADGVDPNLRAQADLTLSLGAMVWPHKLARAMLAEQLYRAASILAGTPYHRK